MSTKTILYDELSRLLASAPQKPRIRPQPVMGGPDSPIALGGVGGERLLEEVLMMRARGETYAGIASKLNRTGVKGTKGGRWYPASLRRYTESRYCEFMCLWPENPL